MKADFTNKLYSKGAEQFYKWLEKKGIDFWEEEDRCYKIIEDFAWNAYYNANYKIPSVEFGYFVITEAYGTEMADEYLKDYMEEYTLEELNEELAYAYRLYEAVA